MKLYRGFATVGAMTILSRVLGFVRDVLIAAVLGTSVVADAFFVAFRVPNMFRRLFAEGAFDAAFVPLFAKRLHGDGLEAARAFAGQALCRSYCSSSSPSPSSARSPCRGSCCCSRRASADDPEKFALAVLLARIALPLSRLHVVGRALYRRAQRARPLRHRRLHADACSTSC